MVGSICWKSYRNYWFGRITVGTFFICIILFVYLFIVSPSDDEASSCPTPAPRQPKNGSYLTYIMFALSNRLNFTKSVLDTRLPGFFNATHRRCVPHNDSRMYRNGGVGAGALMLSYIDLWREIGAKPDSELADDDWVFLFEDDVDIIPLEILKSFYPKLFVQWSRTGQSQSLAGNEQIKRRTNHQVLFDRDDRDRFETSQERWNSLPGHLFSAISR